jgi:integrase
MIRVIALTGCRRSEVIGFRSGEVDIEGSCLRLADSKEEASVRPISPPVLEYLEVAEEEQPAEDFVFPGWEDGTPFGSFPRQWTKLFKNTDLPASRRMFYDIASPVSAMILGSPKQPSPPLSVIHEGR